jgi:hypothetical protein
VLKLKIFLKSKIQKFQNRKMRIRLVQKRIVDLESLLRTQAESHKYEMMKLKEKFNEVNENFEVEKAKRKLVEVERDRVKKNVDELRETKEQCFFVAA